MKLSYDPVILLLDAYSKALKVGTPTGTHLSISTEALFTTVRRWESTNELISKMWYAHIYTHTMNYYSATRMKF